MNQEEYKDLINEVKKSKKLILKKDKEIESKESLVATYKNYFEKQKEENVRLKQVI